ncbi:MAG: GntR family transcriptional regulator [Paludibacteraceae bacterium]|nr:GntR family transcriptional regulator [Paludibacteraceae bacterium]
MKQLGKTQNFRVVKEVEFGIYLDGEEWGEVLMPSKYVPEHIRPGDELTGFLYLDSTGRPVVTTLQPLVEVGGFALLEVVQVTSVGAFLAWGIAKDLLLPFSEQKRDFQVGDRAFVHVYEDSSSHRVVATQKWERFLGRQPFGHAVGDEVDLQIAGTTPLGYKAVIDGAWLGLLYKNEVFRPLHLGDRMRGYVKTLRPDGKVDLSLRRAGYAGIASEPDRLAEAIRGRGGFLPLTDKSPAEDVYDCLQMSKKTFKKAVGDLYKRRLIELDADGLRWVGK